MADSVHPITITVNGERHELTVLGRQLLVHALRDLLGLSGTHIGCDSGNCGACTVIWDGKIAKSCMLLAVQADGSELRLPCCLRRCPEVRDHRRTLLRTGA